ncbi:MAG: polysaccharide deacetylase family protein [Deltaproteobacteria bacterium]|nr:polysaccharide deacetylase family protein [Deltaproteobacteria bacterium]MDQ3298889.1 polysaccharide deacetylase family protein [Myxococcota bacterium]
MRERIAGLLHRTGALSAVMGLRQYMPVPTLSIVTYHHVADQSPTYPYDPDVADATPVQFRRQMEMLARHCTPIGVDELIKSIEGEPLPKNPVMVTFDDGYRSCHDVALPILRAVGVRATFFISTSFVTERRLYWWERISLLIANAPRVTATINYPQPIELDRNDPSLRHQLTKLIKNTASLDVDRFLDELFDAFGLEWSPKIEAAYADGLIMTWDQVRALTRAGMDVESHGRRHRVLQTLDEETLDDELAGSRADLEFQLGRPIRAVAYPVGRRIARDTRIRDAIASAGYRIGLTNASGVNRVWPLAMRGVLPIDPFDVRRLSTDRTMSDAMFLTQVAVPRLAYIARINQ